MDQTLGEAHSLTTELARSILLDKSTVPRGQLLPVCQDPLLSAPFQFVENNWMNQCSAFTHFSCAFTPPAIAHSCPQMGSDQVSTLMPLDITSGQDNPVAFPPLHFDKAYRPPELKNDLSDFDSWVKQSDSLLIDLTDNTAEVFPNQQVIPLSQSQSASLSSAGPVNGNETHAIPRVLSNSLVLESDSQRGTVSPSWLDLFLDSNNLSFPDADLESALSPETGSV